MEETQNQKPKFPRCPPIPPSCPTVVHFNEDDLPPPAKRGPGRPTQRVIGPERSKFIADAYLQGKTMEWIAERIGVSIDTVWYHIEHKIRPWWKKTQLIHLEVELAKIGQMERVAWECFEKSLKPESIEQISKEFERAGVDKLTSDRGIVVLKGKKLSTSIKRGHGESCWLSVIQWCIQKRLEIGGHFAKNNKLDVSIEGNFRVAGSDRESVDRAALDRLRTLIEERRQIAGTSIN